MFLLGTCQTKCSSPCNVPDTFLPVSRYPCPQCHIFGCLNERLLRILLYLLKMGDEILHRQDRGVNLGKRTNLGVEAIVGIEWGGAE